MNGNFDDIHTRPKKIETYSFLMMWSGLKSNSSLEFRKLLTLKLSSTLLGLAALAFERLVISGHSSSVFGKYFRGQRNHKTHEEFKNSYAKTAGLVACLLGIFTRHVHSATSQVS